MGANNPTGDLPPVKGAHINMDVTVSYSCGECNSTLGAADQLEITKEKGFRGDIPAESMECPVCHALVTHRKLNVVEI